MAAVDLADLLTPKTAAPCPVATALQAVDEQYRDQLTAALTQVITTQPGYPSPIPQANIVEAFRRLGQTISEHKMRDHIRGRCTCA